MSAWHHVARGRGLASDGTTAKAKLRDDGILWDITLRVPTTQSLANRAQYRLSQLLSELRVPVHVRVEGAPVDVADGDQVDGRGTAGDRQYQARDDG